MSFVALVVRGYSLNVSILKEIHKLTKMSLIDTKKSTKEGNPLAVVNMNRSTERDEVKVFLSLLKLCNRENINYQLVKDKNPIDKNSEILKGETLTLEDFNNLLDQAKLIELQTQDFVDKGVDDVDDF